MHRRSTSLVLVLAAVFATSCDDGPTAPRSQRQFRVRDVHAQLMTVRIDDPAVVAQAEQLLRSGEQRWVVGRLQEGNGGFNQPWSWHLDPGSIELAEVTIEACQTTVRGVEDDLDYWRQYSRTAGPLCVGGVFVGRD
jgi:hypothetical protein